MKTLLGVSESEEINESYDAPSQRNEIAIVRNIIEGQIKHSSDDAVFKNLRKLYDL